MRAISGSARDVGGDVKHSGNNRRRGHAVGHPVAPLDDPSPVMVSQSWIRAGRQQSCFGRGGIAGLGPFEGTKQVCGRLQASFGREMVYQPIDVGFSFSAERDHASGGHPGLLWAARIRAMLARSRSRTGSSGTIFPDFICASLRSSDSCIQLGGSLSGTFSMGLRIGRDWRNCQRAHQAARMDRRPNPVGNRVP
jgi:hypothetical protein